MSKLTNDILSGVHDSNLDDIERSIKNRRDVVGRMIQPGDRVKIQDSVRPKYISGLFGTVVRLGSGSRLVVKLDSPTAARYYASGMGEIQIPGHLLVKI